jgi:hypothetical protein
LPLLRFLAPSALSGPAALCGRATSRTHPLRRLATPLRLSPSGLAGYAPHGPLAAAFRSLPTVALPGRARFLVSTITTRPAAPMGFTLRGFHPIRKALEPFSSAYPAYCSFQRPPWLFLPKVWLSTTDSSAEPMPRHSHPLVPYDSQNGALKTQLPGFVQPNDPRRTMPSFHGAPRCRPGLCNT